MTLASLVFGFLLWYIWFGSVNKNGRYFTIESDDRSYSHTYRGVRDQRLLPIKTRRDSALNTGQVSQHY